MSWTLYDFPQVPSQVAGKWPGKKIRQKKFGFIDVKGKKTILLYLILIVLLIYCISISLKL
jgi:hypothetical protein